MRLIVMMMVAALVVLSGCADSSVNRKYVIEQQAGDCPDGAGQEGVVEVNGRTVKVPCGSNLVILEAGALDVVGGQSDTAATQDISPQTEASMVPGGM